MIVSHFVPARQNPFAIDRVTSLPFRLPEGDWPALMTRLQDLNYRGAVVGPHGTGNPRSVGPCGLVRSHAP